METLLKEKTKIIDFVEKDRKVVVKKPKKVKQEVLLKGENHLHIIEGDFEIYKKKRDKYSGDFIVFIDVNSTAVLKHVMPDMKTKAEHGSILLDKGTYTVGKMTEYDYKNNIVRQVLD